MIARKPKRKEGKAIGFIRGASAPNKPAKRRKVRVITGVDEGLLERVDAAAAAQGLNRSAFVMTAIAERLRQLEM